VKEVPVANDDPIDFIDAPHSELERTIEELVERAQLVLRTQGRLRHLLEANRVVVEELDIEQVLRRIAEAAVALVDAQYGALGVVSGDGSLERFIHVGIPDDAAAVIGHLPQGHGLLGAVIDTGQPIRLAHLDDDSRSVGFPAHHPHMDSFLGVPIRVRGEVFGNLSLTNRSGGAFSTEDQELVAALAATAGIAIENARLFDETRRRQRWSAALAEVTASLLSGSASNVLAVVAERVASVIDAELVCVVVADNEDGYLRVDTARGVQADKVEGMRFAAAGTLAGAAMDSGQLAVVDSAVDEQPFSALGSLGPTVALPLLVSGEAIGVLSVARAPGAARFASSDLDMASEFATQAGVAIELTRARADRERLGLIEERGRIARDLHDHVIQRLFGSGLALQSIAAANPPLADRVETEVRAIDAAINEIRTAVFALSARSGSSTAVRHRILDVVAEVTPLLASPPRLALSGPIDLLVTGALADDLVAVVREGLTNVARHANATVCELEIDVTDAAVRVQILDDGVGIAAKPDRSSGTANLRERAALHGGQFSVTAREASGTQVVWSAPIEAIGGDK
jgi:signal transduction histidine kinase